MKKLYLCIILFIVSGINALGQIISINLEKISSDKRKIEIVISIYNSTDSVINVFDFKEDDVCYGLLNISFIDSISKKRYSYFPCKEYAADLDRLYFNEHNTIKINPKEKILKKIIICKGDINPKIKKSKTYIINLYLEGKYLFANQDYNCIYRKTTPFEVSGSIRL
jgi:hypothetical protein